MNHRPVAIGLLLCEQVIVEEGTHNVTPVNCFNVRELEEFPAEISFCVLAWLTDASGEMRTEAIVSGTLHAALGCLRSVSLANTFFPRFGTRSAVLSYASRFCCRFGSSLAEAGDGSQTTNSDPRERAQGL